MVGSAFVYSTYVGIICDPLIEFIINRHPQNKSMMVKTASAIDVPFGRRRPSCQGTFLNPLVTPLCLGSLDFLILIYEVSTA